jgi:8-oxo-dGTP pyrophosphatase MutT (NUDIX family)
MADQSFFEAFCNNLGERLLNPLPGFEAQKLMEPPNRKHFLQMPRNQSPREGAVLIVVFPESKGISTVMIQRAIYDGVHSGQIAFPGGRRDQNDKTLIETALREAQEEVGIMTSSMKVLGTLSKLYIPPSNFDVLPVVAYLSNPPDLKIQKEEVSEAFYVPLKELVNPENCRLSTIDLKNFGLSKVPSYCVEDKVIWGATAMIISELLTIIPPFDS